jgi:hypothetical protein
MSSELPATTRDAELRHMLVATASAAPIRPRRRWSVAAPIAAFALAGALTGTVSATALNVTNAPEDDQPIGLDNAIAMSVYDATQLFGEPVELDGQGITVIPVGAIPEGATELVVVFGCRSAGTFDLFVDGELEMTTVCSENSSASGGGASYFTVEDKPTHAVTINTGDNERYAVWASWVARAVPPVASPELAAAIADGEVTEAEYNAQFDRFSECMTAGGYPLGSINKFDKIFTASIPGAAATSGVYDRCYAEHFFDVDIAWQSSQAPQTDIEELDKLLSPQPTEKSEN